MLLCCDGWPQWPLKYESTHTTAFYEYLSRASCIFFCVCVCVCELWSVGYNYFKHTTCARDATPGIVRVDSVEIKTVFLVYPKQ